MSGPSSNGGSGSGSGSASGSGSGSGSGSASGTTASASSGSGSCADSLLVNRVRAAMDTYSYNQIDVMRDSGVSNSVLCLWLQQKYKGDNAKVNERLYKWVQNVEHQHQQQNQQSPSGVRGHVPIFMSGSGGASAAKSTVEELIPCKIDVTIGTQRFQDALLWNIHDTSVSPSWFVDNLVRDLQLPMTFVQPILSQLKSQIKKAKTKTKNGQQNNKRQKQDEGDSTATDRPSKRPRGEPTLLKIVLDLTFDGVQLRDQILWDPDNPLSSPEDFARCMCADLGMGGDWAALIAWSIRDQLAKDAAAVEAGEPSPITHIPFPDNPTALFRNAVSCREWQPSVTVVQPAAVTTATATSTSSTSASISTTTPSTTTQEVKAESATETKPSVDADNSLSAAAPSTNNTSATSASTTTSTSSTSSTSPSLASSVAAAMSMSVATPIAQAHAQASATKPIPHNETGYTVTARAKKQAKQGQGQGQGQGQTQTTADGVQDHDDEDDDSGEEEGEGEQHV